MLFKMHRVLISLAPPGVSDGSGSPAGVVFMLGSPEYGHTAPHATRPRRFSGDASIILLYEIETQVLYLHLIASVILTMPFQFTTFAVEVGTPSPNSPGWTYGHLHEVYSLPDRLRYGYTDAMATNLCEGVAFVPPELPEETLMEVKLLYEGYRQSAR